MHLFHKWDLVETDLYKGRSGDKTGLLYRCTRCPKVKTEWLQGHWTREQITGEGKTPPPRPTRPDPAQPVGRPEPKTARRPIRDGTTSEKKW